MTRLFGVAGNPVFHSKSPLLFNTAFREAQMDAVYIRMAAESAEEAVRMATEIGLDGINITSPFKSDIVGLMDELQNDARLIGAVNTVVRRDGRFTGYNTDTDGVIGAIKSTGFDPAGQKTVVLGAGGAGRAAAFALVNAGADVTIVNRTLEKAEQAAEALHCKAIPLDRVEEALQGARLLVSTITVDKRLVKPHLLSKKPLVLDAVYGAETALVRDALSVGCTVIDGREWLLAQAIPVFDLFTGMQAPTAAMHKALWKKRGDARSNIALIGFMGAGKTVTARALAELSGMDMTDIDAKIEQQEGKTISEIFAAQGEEEFRRLEQAEFEEIQTTSGAVISCGGGAVLNRSNVRVLRNNCISVWLWARPEIVLERTETAGTRPLLDNGDVREQINTLLTRRLSLYASTSDLVIDTAGKSPQRIAERVWNEIRSIFEG